MNATQLLAHFDRLAEAPNAVPRLRRFILDLAVRGKLVAQDAADEPAAELLKRIQVEKARLVKAGSVKASKPLPEIEDVDSSLIPSTWQWTRLAEVGFISPRNTALDDQIVSFVPMPMIAADYGIPNQHDARPWREIKTGYTHFAEGDVGLAKITPCFENGKSTVFRGLTNGIGAGTTELHIVRPVLLSANYILTYLKSSQYIAKGIPRMTGTAGQKRVPTEYFAQTPFPLPPLAEQHRIVAKVDELMALCDQLEAAQQEREHRRDRLAAASLQRLNQPAADSTPETEREHVRFHLRHLPRLTTRPAHIKSMRQTILNLAVHGRLVAQNANEEPAVKLLKSIDRERAALLKADCPNGPESKTQLRKQAVQVLPEGLSELPSGWAWATLMQCSLLIVDCHNKTAPYSTSGIPLIRTTNVCDGRFNLKEPKFVDELTYARWSARCEPKPGDILITREAPMGEVAIIPVGMKICLGQRMMLARLVPHTIDPRFLLQSLSDPELMERVQDKPIGATVQHLRVGGVETLLVPLPPLAEQHRIVAKVDELMALCDQLEAQLITTQTDGRRLLEAVLEAALTPA